MRKVGPLAQLQKQLRKQYRQLKSWRKVAVKYDKSGEVLSGAMVRLVASGHDPKHADIRRALGLPVYATVQVCPHCGKVHPPSKRHVSSNPTFLKFIREVAVPFLAAREQD